MDRSRRRFQPLRLGKLWGAVLITLGVMMLICVGVGQVTAHLRENSRSAARRSVSRVAVLEEAPGEASASRSSSAQAIVNAKRALPRFTLNFKPAPKDFDPQDMEYMEGIAMAAAFPLVIGLLCFIFGLLFMMCRGCCNTCGSRKRRPEGYSKKSRYRSLIAFGFFALVASAGCAVALTGNAALTVAVSDFLGAIRRGIDDLVSATETLIDDVNAVQARNGGEPASGDDLLSGVKEGTATFDDVSVQVTGLDSTRNKAMLGLFAWMLAVILVGLGAGLLRLSTVPMLCAIQGILVLFLAWVVVAVTLPLGLVLADVCAKFQEYISDSSAEDAENDEVIGALLSCVNGEPLTETGGVQDTVREGLETAVGEMNSAIEETNRQVNDTAAALDPSGGTEAPQFDLITYNSTAGVFGEIESIDRQVSALNDSVHAEPLADDASKAAVAETARKVADYAALARSVNDFADCSLIQRIVADIERSVCRGVLEAVDLLMAGSFLVGIAMIPGTWLLVLGNKRWPKGPTDPSAAYEAKKLEEGEAGDEFGGDDGETGTGTDYHDHKKLVGGGKHNNNNDRWGTYGVPEENASNNPYGGGDPYIANPHPPDPYAADPYAVPGGTDQYSAEGYYQNDPYRQQGGGGGYADGDQVQW